MTVPLDVFNGSLVTDGNGHLVAGFVGSILAEFTVKTFNPACAITGPNGEPASGWAVGWRVKIGGGAMAEYYVAHSAGESAENTSDNYSGTFTTAAPSFEVQLQLRAWRNVDTGTGEVLYEYRPNGQLLEPGDISFTVEVGGERISRTFYGTNPSTAQGSWVAGAPYHRVVGTYDFLAEKWSLAGSVVFP